MAGYETVDGGAPDWGSLARVTGVDILSLMWRAQMDMGTERFRELQDRVREEVPPAVMGVVMDECENRGEQGAVYCVVALMMIENLNALFPDEEEE